MGRIKLVLTEIHTCLDCPNREQGIGENGEYSICRKTNNVIYTLREIPKFCPLEDAVI